MARPEKSKRHLAGRHEGTVIFLRAGGVGIFEYARCARGSNGLDRIEV